MKVGRNELHPRPKLPGRALGEARAPGREGRGQEECQGKEEESWLVLRRPGLGKQ